MSSVGFKGDVWIGTSLGILKGVSISRKETLNFLPSNVTLSQTDKSREVLCMCWEYNSKDQLYVGLRNGVVQVFDCQRNYFTAECDLTGGNGHFVGLSKHENTLISCINEGVVSFWPDQSEKSEINIGNNVDIMVASPNTHLLVATGGKENDLKLWDGNKCEAPPIFKAKNVPNDYLNLRVPIWVTSIGIVPGKDERPLVAVGTAHHHLRLYDTRANPRPVYSHLWEESPITTLDITSDVQYYLVGNAHGKIARIDLRKGDVVNRYHGFGGSVCSISSFSDDTRQVFASCGLDRYLRIYNIHPPSLIYKSYMKLHCQSVLISSIHESADKEDIDLECKRSKMERLQEEEEEEEEEDEKLWEQMEVVETKHSGRSKKHKLVQNLKTKRQSKQIYKI